MMYCPKCEARLDKDGCPECGWGKPPQPETLARLLNGDRTPPVYEDIVGEIRDHYMGLIDALSRCSLLPSSYDKRFIQSMNSIAHMPKNDPLRISTLQRQYLDDLQWKYRRQLTGTKFEVRQ